MIILPYGIAALHFFVDTETSSHLRYGSVFGPFPKTPAAIVYATNRAYLKRLPDGVVVLFKCMKGDGVL